MGKEAQPDVYVRSVKTEMPRRVSRSKPEKQDSEETRIIKSGYCEKTPSDDTQSKTSQKEDAERTFREIQAVC